MLLGFSRVESILMYTYIFLSITLAFINVYFTIIVLSNFDWRWMEGVTQWHRTKTATGVVPRFTWSLLRHRIKRNMLVYICVCVSSFSPICIFLMLLFLGLLLVFVFYKRLFLLKTIPIATQLQQLFLKYKCCTNNNNEKINNNKSTGGFWYQQQWYKSKFEFFLSANLVFLCLGFRITFISIQ